MKDRITGRYLAEDIVDPETGEILIKKNHMITPKRAEIIEKGASCFFAALDS